MVRRIKLAFVSPSAMPSRIVSVKRCSVSPACRESQSDTGASCISTPSTSAASCPRVTLVVISSAPTARLMDDAANRVSISANSRNSPNRRVDSARYAPRMVSQVYASSFSNRAACRDGAAMPVGSMRASCATISPSSVRRNLALSRNCVAVSLCRSSARPVMASRISVFTLAIGSPHPSGLLRPHNIKREPILIWQVAQFLTIRCPLRCHCVVAHGHPVGVLQ